MIYQTLHLYPPIDVSNFSKFNQYMLSPNVLVSYQDDTVNVYKIIGDSFVLVSQVDVKGEE